MSDWWTQKNAALEQRWTPQYGLRDFDDVVPPSMWLPAWRATTSDGEKPNDTHTLPAYAQELFDDQARAAAPKYGVMPPEFVMQDYASFQWSGHAVNNRNILQTVKPKIATSMDTEHEDVHLALEAPALPNAAWHSNI